MSRWWTRRSVLRATAGIGLGGAAGCARPRDLVPPPEPRVEFAPREFEPSRLVIDPGETVTWWNTDFNRHTVTAYERRIPTGAEYFASGGFDSETAARGENLHEGILEEGDRFEHQFTTPGHYQYCCIPHEDLDPMVGTVVVRTEDGETPSPPEVVLPDTDHVVGMGAHEYYPESIRIRAGDSVGWVNGTGIAHSVTGEAGGDVIPEGDDREFPEDGEYFASGGFESAEAALDGWRSGREGDVLPDEPFVHTFETPGEYPYLCILHQLWMRGTVVVFDP